MEKNTRIAVISGIVLVAGLVAYRVMAKNTNTLNTFPKLPNLPEAPPIEDMPVGPSEKPSDSSVSSNKPTIEQLANDLFAAFNGYGTAWDNGVTGGVTGIMTRIKSDEDFDALNQAYGIRTVDSGFLNLFSKDYTGDMNGAFNSELSLSEIIEVNKILEKNGVNRRITTIPNDVTVDESNY